MNYIRTLNHNNVQCKPPKIIYPYSFNIIYVSYFRLILKKKVFIYVHILDLHHSDLTGNYSCEPFLVITQKLV